MKVYREAWPGSSVWGMKMDFDTVKKLKPFPEDASAESILRGEHGDASWWRLFDLTQKICLGIFTESPAAVESMSTISQPSEPIPERLRPHHASAP